MFILYFFLQSLMAQSCDHLHDRFNCVEYLYNYDGDSITFNIPQIHPFFGKKAKIRVLGIDTPERKPKNHDPCEKEWARTAQKLVETELKSAKRIDLTHLQGLDKYGRILSKIEYDGKDLSEILIKNHLAFFYEGQKKPKVNWCEMMKKPRTTR
jgi:micrococcal nuclease